MAHEFRPSCQEQGPTAVLHLLAHASAQPSVPRGQPVVTEAHPCVVQPMPSSCNPCLSQSWAPKTRRVRSFSWCARSAGAPGHLQLKAQYGALVTLGSLDESRTCCGCQEEIPCPVHATILSTQLSAMGLHEACWLSDGMVLGSSAPQLLLPLARQHHPHLGILILAHSGALSLPCVTLPNLTHYGP